MSLPDSSVSDITLSSKRNGSSAKRNGSSAPSRTGQRAPLRVGRATLAPLHHLRPYAAWERPMSTDQTFFGADFGQLTSQDPEIAGVLLSELERLRGGLQLIASENLTSPAVLAALGSTLSNKYAEGYPGRRYYGGCSEVDKAELIGIERAKALFGADHANLQPHSGASANLAVFGAFYNPGVTILSMSLPHGGHLTHGSKVSFSGKWFNAVHYGVDKETEDIDYDSVAALARQHSCLLYTSDAADDLLCVDLGGRRI